MIRKSGWSSAPWSCNKTYHNTKVNGISKLTKSTGEAIRYGVMAAFTKATGRMGKLMAGVDLFMPMATSTMESGRMTSHMATENTLKMTEQSTGGPGSMTRSMVRAKRPGPMEQAMKAITNTDKRLGSANLNGNKVLCTKDIS